MPIAQESFVSLYEEVHGKRPAAGESKNQKGNLKKRKGIQKNRGGTKNQKPEIQKGEGREVNKKKGDPKTKGGIEKDRLGGFKNPKSNQKIN